MENTTQIMDTYDKIQEILDMDYFHISLTQKDDGDIEWSVFYKNLNSKDYFSDRNICLLSSKNNTIDDVYRLAAKFEMEKEKARNEIIVDSSIKGFHIIDSFIKLKEKINNIFIICFLINLIIFVAIMLFTNEKSSCIYCNSVNLMVVLAECFISKYVSKAEKEQTNNVLEEDAKLYIKSMGLDFIERIIVQ